MINLLPPQQKKELLVEERFKLVLIFGILTLLFLISLSLILFSVKIYISGQVESQKILINIEEEKLKLLGVQKLEEEIKLINQNLSQLNNFYQKQPNLTFWLTKISETLRPGMYLTALSLTPVPEENKFEVSLKGFAPNRDRLSEFKRNLEAGPFEEIYFPVSNWIDPSNFLVTFEFKI